MTTTHAAARASDPDGRDSQTRHGDDGDRSRRAEIREGLEILLSPCGVHELRILKAGRARTVSGCYDDLDALARDAERWDGRAPGVYVTLNPCADALLARSANRARENAEITTSDKDIARRTRLFVDLDPVRPSGIASTDDEHRAALDRARAIRAALREQGWPGPILMDSGNGSYLLYAVDLPNDSESTEIVSGTLRGLASRYSDDVVAIDTTVSNAARIARIPGTQNMKGDDTPDRPHRRCRIVDAPATLDVVPRELLETLAGEAAGPDREQTQARNGNVYDIDGFVQRHGLEILSDGPWDGKRRIKLARCPFDLEHVGGSAALFVFPSGAISFRCQHDSCAGRKWANVRELFEPARQQQHDAGERVHARDTDDDLPPIPSGRPWPDPIGEAALYGIAGRFVRELEPHTEACREALLFQFLAAAGSLLGRSRYFAVEGDRHFANLYIVAVGPTAKGRKGTSFGRVRRVLKSADDAWQIASGLSSGEGLIWSVRDPITKRVKGKDIVDDPGVDDKRLLIHEGEFASTLRVLGREGNTLSAILRNAWDSGDLRSLTKNSPARATDAHISIVGHIVADEACRYLDRTEAGNGFGNRFLWVCVRRSKLLPHGGRAESIDSGPIIRALESSVASVASVAPVAFDREASALWCEQYEHLSRDRHGLLGALTSRAEAQTVRLALLYALLDCADEIQVEHLRAALACWQYAEASAATVFGTALGDPLADRLLALLREAGPAGMTRTEIRDATGRHRADAVASALGLLESSGLARRKRESTSGRPTERWTASGAGGPCDQSDQSDQSPPDGDPPTPSVASVAFVAPPHESEHEEPPPPDDDLAPEEPSDGWGGEALV